MIEFLHSSAAGDKDAPVRPIMTHYAEEFPAAPSLHEADQPPDEDQARRPWREHRPEWPDGLHKMPAHHLRGCSGIRRIHNPNQKRRQIGEYAINDGGAHRPIQ